MDKPAEVLDALRARVQRCWDEWPVENVRLDRLHPVNDQGEFVSTVMVNGEWIERGRMGWFAVVGPDEEGVGEMSKEKWDEFIASLYNRYRGRKCVLVDCHV